MTKTEEFRVDGERVLAKIKALIKEGNIRSIAVKGRDGKVIASFPLTAGVVGAIIAPPLAAIGAIVALVTDCVIVVERND